MPLAGAPSEYNDDARRAALLRQAIAFTDAAMDELIDVQRRTAALPTP